MESQQRGMGDLPQIPLTKGVSFITDVDPPKPLSMRMDRVFEFHSLLLDKVNSLNDFITEVLRRQEREYLKAVQTQIAQVKGQMSQLKNKSGVKQMEMKKEEEMVRLQQSLAWIKEEAVKLDHTCKKLKDECGRWKVKAEGLESDRRFLEKQLKQAMRQLRALESDPKREDVPMAALPSLHRPPLKLELPNTKSGQYLSQLISHYSPLDPELFLQLETYMTAQEESFKSTLRHYQKVLAGEKRKIESLNSTFSSSFMVKSDLEELFFECVEEVRKAATKRMQTSYPHRRSTSIPQAREAHLSALDKTRILEMLVENEQVLVLLHEHLFPHRKLRTSEQTKEVKDIPEEQLQDLVQLSQAFESLPKDDSFRV